MQMEDAKFEIVLFDTGDIIVTSGESDQGLVETIYLTQTSRTNFNKFALQHGADLLGANKNVTYLGYSGAKAESMDPWGEPTGAYYFSVADTSNELTENVSNGLREINNESDYESVLSWLLMHQK